MTSQQALRNYYDILHVSRDAPVEIIRASYRTLMQRLKKHPDLGGDTATAALINEAYAVLNDVTRRAEYDILLEAAKRSAADSSREDQDSGSAGSATDALRACVFCETAHGLGSFIDADAVCAVCGSPLCVADKRRLEEAGKRAVARITRHQNVTCYTRWPQSEGSIARTEDISLHGLSLATNEEFARGQCIKIVADAFEATGRVTNYRTNEGRGSSFRNLVGISFVTVRFKRSVGAFVSERA